MHALALQAPALRFQTTCVCAQHVCANARARGVPTLAVAVAERAQRHTARPAIAAGLDARVLFAVSSRLRVSEAALEASDAPSELYVYKGALNAREVLRRLDASG